MVEEGVKTCLLLINHHFESINEEKDIWITDWFLIVDLVYLIPPIMHVYLLFQFFHL
jgi:hypothetical protein